VDLDYSILSKSPLSANINPHGSSSLFEIKKLAATVECSQYDKLLYALSVQCKFKDSVSLESGCVTWNRLLLEVLNSLTTELYKVLSEQCTAYADLQYLDGEQVIPLRLQYLLLSLYLQIALIL